MSGNFCVTAVSAILADGKLAPAPATLPAQARADTGPSVVTPARAADDTNLTLRPIFLLVTFRTY